MNGTRHERKQLFDSTCTAAPVISDHMLLVSASHCRTRLINQIKANMIYFMSSLEQYSVFEMMGVMDICRCQ